MKIIMALMTVVFALIFAVAILPAADDMITDERGSDGWNCANAPSYNSSLEENKLTCTVTSITTGLIMLAVVAGGFMYIISPGRDENTPGYGY